MSRRNLRPAKKIVVCEAAENRTASGLLLASDDSGDKAPEIGKVVSIGEGKLPVEIKKDDIIIYRKYTDNKITVEGKEYNFIRFEDIVAAI